MSRPRVCFFARVASPDVLRRVGFYSQDIAMLEELGFDVSLATRPSQIRPADLFFTWWWTWAFVPLLHPLRCGAPVVVTGIFDHWNFPHRPLRERALISLALRMATVNVFNARVEFTEVPKALTVRNPKYIPLVVDTDLYTPGTKPRRPFIFTLATMRHWNPWRKSIPELIRAAPLIRARHPDVRFVLAGDHDPKYPALAREVGAADYIEFPGIIAESRKIELMRECALYLQPSRFEGFGVAIAEALACGAPVVTSAVGEVPEVVGDAAVFVDGTSPDDIARGVSELFGDPERAARLGAAGRQRIHERFSVPGHRARWSSLLSGLV